MQNPDLDQVAVLALVQREAGGNTAEVLDQVIAEHPCSHGRPPSRRRAHRPGQVLVSWIIAAVPVGIFVFLVFVNPSHLDPLFNDPLGQVASISAIVMVLAGFYMIRKIVSIEL